MWEREKFNIQQQEINLICNKIMIVNETLVNVARRQISVIA